MAAYATVMDVHQLNVGRATYTANTKPTASQVIDYLEQTAAKIDAALRGRGYALPIPTTATAALKVLEEGNAVCAWAKVEVGAQNSDRRDQAVQMCRDFMTALKDGGLVLDVPDDTARGDIRFATPDDPVFTRETPLDV